MVQLYIICMEITRCNNYDLYNGACGMFGSTGMIIHINAILNCVGLNAFCTHLIPGVNIVFIGKRDDYPTAAEEERILQGSEGV